MTASRDYAWSLVTVASGAEGLRDPQNKEAVSFGRNAKFDAQVQPLRPFIAEVIVEAKVTDECWPEVADGTFAMCVHRANQLKPVRLLEVLRKEPLPAKREGD